MADQHRSNHTLKSERPSIHSMVTSTTLSPTFPNMVSIHHNPSLYVDHHQPVWMVRTHEGCHWSGIDMNTLPTFCKSHRSARWTKQAAHVQQDTVAQHCANTPWDQPRSAEITQSPCATPPVPSWHQLDAQNSFPPHNNAIAVVKTTRAKEKLSMAGGRCVVPCHTRTWQWQKSKFASTRRLSNYLSSCLQIWSWRQDSAKKGDCIPGSYLLSSE